MFAKRIIVSPVRLLACDFRFMSVNSSSKELVLTEEVNDNGLVMLNRPKALNATSLYMLEKLSNIFNEWKDNKSLIVVRGNGGKAFCAGGDVRAIVEDEQRVYGHKFLKVEYSISHMIGNLNIPYVALIDGVVMGGGVGLAVHGKYRVATENTIFAMPEAKIGAFPDIGSSYFLPRLQGADVLHAGLATHYCDSSKISDLEQELLHSRDPSGVENIINDFCPKPQSDFSLIEIIDKINKCFDALSVEEIITKLQNDDSDWARKTLKILRFNSPTSLKVAFHQLNLGSAMKSLGECLQMEYRLGYHTLHSQEFAEGVRALLIVKDNAPKWNPKYVEDVTEQRVLSYFQSLPDNDELPIDEKFYFEDNNQQKRRYQSIIS